MSPPARVVIADDHDLARAGLRALLAGEAWLQVVGEATDGRQALALCRRERPELALLDVRMPVLDGLAAARALKAELPRIAVVMVTMHEDPDYLLEALRAGAAGYVLKGTPRRDLLAALRRVLAGESLIQPELATQLLRRLASESTPEIGTSGELVEPLTPREREVLGLVAQGHTNRQIAHQLVVSVSTVKAHVEHIIAKLGVSDRTQAAVKAIHLGLLRSARA